MPLVQTRGAASAQGFGEFAQASAVNYIEDVFSTFLYSSTGTSPSAIVNGIDLAGKGGLVIGKVRNYVDGTGWVDTVRGGSNYLQSDVTNEQFNASCYSFNNNGYSLQSTNFLNFGTVGQYNFCSWTFRKQPKFFDVVTYTGNGANRTIAHNLGSVPGCYIVKRTSSAEEWFVYHRSTGNTAYLKLNDTDGSQTAFNAWNNTTPTDTVFSLSNRAEVNQSGATYVAYLFAHDAGGFGLTGTDNVISCGSYVGNGGVLNINVGFEPQWLLVKQSSGSGIGWNIVDNMRGAPVLPSYASYLQANSADAEIPNALGVHFNSTGFNVDGFGGDGSNGQTYIYIAIRRGPMKVPTLGTSVFLPSTAPATTPFNVGFPPDLALWSIRNSTGNKEASTRLQGGSELFTNTTAAEMSGYDIGWASKTNFWYQNVTGGSMINWMFRRAPSFCDVVCYTGTGVARTVAHNLGVAPELMLIKVRTPGGYAWRVYAAPLGVTQSLRLNTDNASDTDTYWDGTAPTSTVFSVNNYGQVNNSGSPIVAYLFASCAGVSKVGSYTGNAGYTVTVPCGFTAGVRFVLIKRTDSTGDWWVYDSARGITSGNDPYLYLNTTAAEVGGTDYIDSYSAGFEVTSTAPAGLNATGGTYIFLAIA